MNFITLKILFYFSKIINNIILIYIIYDINNQVLNSFTLDYLVLAFECLFFILLNNFLPIGLYHRTNYLEFLN